MCALSHTWTVRLDHVSWAGALRDINKNNPSALHFMPCTDVQVLVVVDVWQLLNRPSFLKFIGSSSYISHFPICFAHRPLAVPASGHSAGGGRQQLALGRLQG